MKTEFIDIIEKSRLFAMLEDGNKHAIKAVYDELDRLESIIKDYELGIKMLNNKFDSNIFKKPNTVRAFITEDSMALLSASERKNDDILKKLLYWQENYYDDITWDVFNNDYFDCDKCGGYSTEQCMCYTR